jgi:hypothetical protein
MRKFVEFLVVGLSLAVFVIFLTVFVLDWTGGCGEVFEYANGTLHQGDCVGRDVFFSIFQRVFNL